MKIFKVLTSIFFFFLIINLFAQDPCAPYRGMSLIQYDFLNNTSKDSSYSEVYCLCDSGYTSNFVINYEKTTFCRKLLKSTTKINTEESIIEADFYKVNDTIWDAYYYYPDGYIKENGQILITNKTINSFQIQNVSPCPPYDEYLIYVQVKKTTRKGEWMQFNNNPLGKFITKEY